MKTITVSGKRVALIICLIANHPGVAQKLSLDGDTIYVNDQVQVAIEFPSNIYGDPQLVDPAAPYRLVKKLNSVFITANSKDVKPANAIISEGKRDHSVVLCFKKDIKPDDGDFYDLATPKKLEDFVKLSKERRKTLVAIDSVSAETASSSGIKKEDKELRITALVKDADQAFAREEFDRADSLFAETLKLDEGNVHAKQAKGEISLKREQQKRQAMLELKLNARKVINAQFDSVMALGNVALADKNFDLALEKYREALQLKPLEPIALNQIQSVRNIILQDSLQQLESQKKAIARVQEDIRQKRFKEGMSYYVAYENAAQIADMESEVSNLKRFLDIFPDYSELETNQYSTKIEGARKKINEIRNFWNRTRKNYQPQIDTFPYLTQDFERKFPSINLNSARKEQQMVADPDKVEDAIQITKEMVAERPRLNFADSVSNVKVVCENIRVIKEKAYFKIKIQNRDTTDFLTGTMAVSLIKKDGNIIKNYPYYLSSFPVVLPGKDFFIIYSAKDMDVTIEDSLSFEMNERLRKIKFAVHIPGQAYNEEKKFEL